MSRKILFFLSSESFHARIWKNGSLSASQNFSSSAEGLRQFSDFLQTIHDPVYLLVDLIEEDFRQEVVPHLTGSNYQALLQRKFDQYYRSTPFRLARLQQRLSDGRRDDELLFSALTNANRISAWLDLLLEFKIPLAGIYSVPHVSLPLINTIDSDHLLLLSWEKDAGLRQSYFLNRRLRFSRLTLINPNSTFADAVATESTRTQQYLQSLSLTPQGQTLNVHILCHQDDRPQLDARLRSNHNMQYAYVDLPQMSRQLKLKHEFRDSDATPLLLHILATQAPRIHYANADQTHYYQLWQTRRGLYGLSAAAAIVCLIWSIISFIDGNSMKAEIGDLQQQVQRMNLETRNIVQQFPGGNGNTVSAGDMKTVVTLLRNLQQQDAPPQKILQGLTRTLDEFPRISTSKIAWQPVSAGGLPAQQIDFTGELQEFGSDFRAAINYLERFQQALTKTGYTVTLDKLPVDFSSKGSLSNEIAPAGNDNAGAFTLKLIWRAQP